MQHLVAHALELEVTGEQVAFITRRTSDGAAVGSTRFLHIDRANKTVEIGWTWLGKDARRKAINTEGKLLQLAHLFEIGANPVWVQTHKLNEPSRRAIERNAA